MSSGVSDQIKIAGNADKIKHVEPNIPWSQQVEEASDHENLASPINHNKEIGRDQTSTKFQNPPFSSPENRPSVWNNLKSRRSEKFDVNKKHDKHFFYHASKCEETSKASSSSMRSPKPTTDCTKIHSIELLTYNDETSGITRRDIRSSNDINFDSKTVNSTSFTSKKTTWASIASQPVKQSSRTNLITLNQKKKGPGMPPPPMVPGKHDLEVNVWDPQSENTTDLTSTECLLIPKEAALNTAIMEKRLNERKVNKVDSVKSSKILEEYENIKVCNSYGVMQTLNKPINKECLGESPIHLNQQRNIFKKENCRRDGGSNFVVCNLNKYVPHGSQPVMKSTSVCLPSSENVKSGASCDEILAILDDLKYKNNYNPLEIDLEKALSARFFVIKSYSEDDIHRSIKYEIWCSTENGNKRLDAAFKERAKGGGNVLLLFSVNGSGHFCGMAQMMTPVDYNSTASVWSQDKWKGKFKVKWIYVKDVPNANLRHIILENNENKSVTKSRDTQEVPNIQGIEMMQIMHSFNHTTSLFDDFSHYEVRQREEINCSKQVVDRFYRRTSAEKEIRNKVVQNNNSAALRLGNGRGASFRDRDTYRNLPSCSEHRNYEIHPNLGHEFAPNHRPTNSNFDTDECRSRQLLRTDHHRRVGHVYSKSSNTDKEMERKDDLHEKKESRFHVGKRDHKQDNENTIPDSSREFTS